MRFLLDTNIFLEVILEQEKAQEARDLLSKTGEHEFFVSDYSMHSIGLLLFRRKQPDMFKQFLADMLDKLGLGMVVLSFQEMAEIPALAGKFNLDFDDTYQYAAAVRHDLIIVSLDSDFDRIERGRQTPGDILWG